MIKKSLVFEKLIEILFFVSFSLIFLDSYQLFFIPITWMGSSILIVTILLIYLKENIKINKLFLLILTICLIPTTFNILANNNFEKDFFYTSLRLFSFISFAFTIYILPKSSYKEISIKILKSVFLIALAVSFYAFFAQLFNFYEPLRNRPGTGVLGFDTQTNFWLSGSHRMSGTFREPVFMVSLLFPCFLVIHYKALNSKFFYLFSGLLFGLAKSELALIFILIFFITEILLKNFNHKVMIFLLAFTTCFFLSINECDISPSNIECPQYESSNTTQSIDETLDNQASSPNTFEFNNKERLETVSFTLEFLNMNTGLGFDSTNEIYTDYLSQDISNEMYLINRTLPKYLNIRYLSKSFGTGRYFLTYEDINIQNNFLFNLFSIGMFYLVILFLAFIYLLKTNFSTGLKIIFIMICISLAAYEDLLPIFGLYLGLMFTMDKNANK
tara:strand:+ start:1290 stop:2621 length:1332 start_codon:yes stop_codon:yes gene_type:complete